MRFGLAILAALAFSSMVYACGDCAAGKATQCGTATVTAHTEYVAKTVYVPQTTYTATWTVTGEACCGHQQAANVTLRNVRNNARRGLFGRWIVRSVYLAK